MNIKRRESLKGEIGEPGGDCMPGLKVPGMDRLRKVYVEATNQCNLNCRTCIRSTWDIKPGYMSFELFLKLLRDLGEFEPYPGIFFGGYGEPLTHPRIGEMIAEAHRFGAETSLITNGTLLDPESIGDLIAAGLDRIWVSLDGAHIESCRSIQQGTPLRKLIKTLSCLQSGDEPKPFLGIATVLTKHNVEELPAVVEVCQQLDVDALFISHLEAYQESMREEILYDGDFLTGNEAVNRMNAENDPRWISRELADLPSRGIEVLLSQAGNEGAICPFVERGAAVVRWDGEVSPCLPLLYSHTTYLGSWVRNSIPYLVGNIQSRTMRGLWLDGHYSNLRERLSGDQFSPCHSCRDCGLSVDNLQDCMGYDHPTCGGCLWARGYIQCP